MANQLLTQLESFQSESESSTILYVCVYVHLSRMR